MPKIVYRLATALAAVCISAFGFIANASPASACTAGTHCYAYYSNYNQIGGSVTINPRCLSADSGNFVTDEVWLGDANNQSTSWIEAGYIDINNFNQPWVPADPGTYAFWGIARGDGTYYFHPREKGPTLSPGMDVAVWNGAPDDYTVTISTDGGLNFYQSDLTATYSNTFIFDYGSESTQNHGATYSDNYHAKRYASGAWTLGMSNPQPHTDAYQHLEWITSPSSYRAGQYCSNNTP
jgi:hypothetical protein